MAETPLVSFRWDRTLIRRVDAAARCHGWTRTTWVLRAVGRALDEDEAVYGPTPDQVARSVQYRADAVERTRRWRQGRSGSESVPGTAAPGAAPV